MTGLSVPHAAGYVDNGGPKVVTSRFDHEDSFTLERSLATGGYAGLRAARPHHTHVHRFGEGDVLSGPREDGSPPPVQSATSPARRSQPW